MIRILKIEGMMCAHCSARVEAALNALPGVKAKVDLGKKCAEVSGAASEAQLKEAVEKGGYNLIEIIS